MATIGELRVAVIGAGAAGLATARELLEGGHQPVVFERSDHVGGVWVYEHRVGPASGSMYANLRTNLPRRLMSFRGVPFEGGGTEFPGHAAVGEYLGEFARRLSLRPYVRLQHEVTAVVPRHRDGRLWRWPTETDSVVWDVTVAVGGRSSTERFDAVAVCNGHYAIPNLPTLAGADRFPGRLLHSRDYRRPEPFAGQQVVLVGAKASGLDLSRDIGHVAARVHLCARGQIGCTTEGARANVDRRANVAALHADGTVSLADGTRLPEIDAVVLCTGYRYAFEFLDPATRVIDVIDNDVRPLWLTLIAARLPSLAFVGLPFMVVPFAMFERQAAFFSAVLGGRVPLPTTSERLRASAVEARQLDARDVAPRHRLRMGDRQVAYCNDLAKRCQYPELPPWFASLHEAVRELRRAHPDDYRDRAIPRLDS